MSKIHLSIRMKTVADMVIPGGVIADIGCDHAFVSIYLIEHQIAKKVIASDVRTGPISIASNNVTKSGLEDHIDIRLGNGLETLQPQEADTIIIAGMGGILMNQIIERREQVAKSVKQLVLQPQSDIDLVRKKLRDMDATIVREDMVVDMGKYYTVIDARFHTDGYQPVSSNFEQELYDRYGAFLLQNKHPVLFAYLEKEYAANEKILVTLEEQDSENAKRKKLELQHLKQYMEAAFKYYDQ